MSNSRLKFTSIALSFVLYTSLSFAQDARSIFDSGTGVGFSTSNLKKDKTDLVSSTKSDIKNNSNQKKNQKEITKLNNDKKSANKPKVKPVKNETTQSYTGLSYTIFKKSEIGKYSKVYPDQIFRTGDRIRVEVKSNKPGRLYTVNINPQGEINLISVETISPKYTTKIPQNGDLRFDGKPGQETLMFILEKSQPDTKPMSKEEVSTILQNCKTKASTRSLVVDDRAGNQYGLIGKDSNCGSSKKMSKNTRSLVVDIQEDTSYGVIEDNVFDANSFLTLNLTLNHR